MSRPLFRFVARHYGPSFYIFDSLYCYRAVFHERAHPLNPRYLVVRRAWRRRWHELNGGTT